MRCVRVVTTLGSLWVLSWTSAEWRWRSKAASHAIDQSARRAEQIGWSELLKVKVGLTHERIKHGGWTRVEQVARHTEAYVSRRTVERSTVASDRCGRRSRRRHRG